MTTLLQRFLEGGGIAKGSENDATAESLYEWAMRRLTPPLPSPDGVPTQEALEEHAQRFIFHEDGVGAIKAQLRAGHLDSKSMQPYSRLPASPCWIEWPAIEATGRWRLGMLLQYAPLNLPFTDSTTGLSTKTALDTLCVGFTESADGDGALPYLAIRMPRLPHQGDMDIGVTWWAPQLETQYGGTPAVRKEAQSLAQDAMALLFLLNVPRVVELVDHVPGPKLQRARDRRGKPPLLEYKRVTLALGLAAPPRVRYARGDDDGGTDAAERARRKYHQVIGHFNSYHTGQGRTNIKVRWLSPLWRGDPKLGVVLSSWTWP